MSNILIAQIGRGNYQETKYLNGNQLENNSDFTKDEHIYSTGYTFEAIIHEIHHEKKKRIDHVILIGTETSYFGTLLHYYYRKSIGEEGDLTPEKYDSFVELPELEAFTADMKLESFPKPNGDTGYNIRIDNIGTYLNKIDSLLSRYLSCITENKELRVKLVIIQHGITSKELENNFDQLRESVEDIMKEKNIDAENKLYNVFFDISNGFRSLPMYIYTFINYLLRIRDEQFKLHMFYGMADGKKNGIAPIVDLENINGMMEWINAANEFHNYGSVRQLVGLLDDNSDLKTLFQKFDYASNANNLGVLRTTTEEIIKLTGIKEFANLPYYATALLCRIGEEFYQEFGQEKCNSRIKKGKYSYAYLTIHLAHWYMEQGRTGNARRNDRLDA